MRIVYFYYLIILLFIYNCILPYRQETPPGVLGRNPLLYTFNSTIDFSNIKDGDIEEATTFALKKTDIILQKILNILNSGRTFENTLLRLDDIYNTIGKVWNIISLLSSVHPLENIREEANRNDLRIQNYMMDIAINEKLYRAINAYAQLEEAKLLTGGRKLFLDSELRDFKINGMELSLKKRNEIKKLSTRVSELSIIFSNNITSNSDTLFILENMTDGLPESYKKERLQKDGSYAIDLSYPSFDPFMKYSDIDSLRKKLRFMYLNIGFPDNISILDEIIYNSNKIANILGYSSYAEYAIEESMAKTPFAVWGFENMLRDSIKLKSYNDTREMVEIKKELSGKDSVVIHDWDKYYYENKLLLAKYNVDSKKVKEYFEINQVIGGFFHISELLFGLRYIQIENASVWHEDVIMYEVYDSEKNVLMGRFYLDLYPRSNKYQHAAEYTIANGKKMGDSYQLPIAALVCNFPKGSIEYPSLLSHEDVETFFHEFGHLIHEIVTKAELSSQSGTSVVMDFVEAPAQMLENWAWNKESLSFFSRHYKTKKVIPDTLIDRMIASKNLQSGNDALQQIFYGLLDLSLYDGYDPSGGLSSTDIVVQLQNAITNYSYFHGTHQQASFDHLLDYSASYYGYLWSKVYAEDMFSVFEENGVLNPEVGRHFRKTVLEKGSSENAMQLVVDFLGRKSNNKAFIKSLGIVR